MDAMTVTANTDGRELRVIDLLSYSASHLSINSFWIRELTGRGEFHVVGEAEHLGLLADAAGTSFRARPIRKRSAWKVLREFYFVRAVLGHRHGAVFVMGATGLQILLLALLELIMPLRASRWLVVCHSEVEGVAGARGVMKRTAGIAIRRLRFPRRAKCVVLGRHIKASLAARGLDSERVHSIEHPLPPVQIREMRPIRKSAPVLAVVGLLRGDTKDLSVSATVARQPGVSVSMIGRVGPDFVSQTGVHEDVVSSHYSEAWLQERLGGVDALLLCPAQASYRFTALGSVGDAIAYARCACWIRHEALTAYEDAPFAVCADSAEELVRRIREFDAPGVQAVTRWMQAWNERASQQISALWDAIGFIKTSRGRSNDQ